MDDLCTNHYYKKLKMFENKKKYTLYHISNIISHKLV